MNTSISVENIKKVVFQCFVTRRNIQLKGISRINGYIKRLESKIKSSEPKGTSPKIWSRQFYSKIFFSTFHRHRIRCHFPSSARPLYGRYPQIQVAIYCTFSISPANSHFTQVEYFGFLNIAINYEKYLLQYNKWVKIIIFSTIVSN